VRNDAAEAVQPNMIYYLSARTRTIPISVRTPCGLNSNVDREIRAYACVIFICIFPKSQRTINHTMYSTAAAAFRVFRFACVASLLSLCRVSERLFREKCEQHAKYDMRARSTAAAYYDTAFVTYHTRTSRFSV